MTTTGAAKNRTLLQKVGPKILIVEEAAEVLESHIVTTLNENCQHLILIGDHKQLRPNPTVYDLAKRYKLDVSLFERMIRNRVPCITLSEQHRMRPEISVLMRHTNLYPNLRDHPSVKLYESVAGIDGDVCFIDHIEIEEQGGESTSYYNSFEANYLASLCKYLLMQGYKSEQITVLSPYMGQVLALRKAMPKHEFDGVRITAVDNFQGEENDIILLSLVRSSPKDGCFAKKNPIGFLGIENRVCVALSRARKGLYVIGNFEHLATYSELWQYMVTTMHGSKRLKKSLKLRCQNHLESIIEVATAEDFKQAPDGGCMLSCMYRLKCGHICQRFCHVLDKSHELYRCFKPCARTKPCGHKCGYKCYQECTPCLTMTEKIMPICGHKAIMQCKIDPADWICGEKCLTKLPCGHNCGLRCGDCKIRLRHRERCVTEVKKAWPCGHISKTKCFQNPEVIPCPQPCNAQLNCGHTCSGTCGECLQGRIHKTCSETCKKTLLCGHHCSFPCSEICPPCTRKCEWVCSHGVGCSNKCSQECHRCVETCAIKCSHKRCTRECSEECERYKCDMPCKKILQCGHPCTSLCGESCPILCPLCEPAKYQNIDERVIFLKDCKCIISVTRMDCYMEQTSKVENSRIVPMFRCPNCNKPIINVIKRYINFMKERRQRIVERNRAVTGTARERQLEARRLQTKIHILKGLGLTPLEEKVLDVNLTKDEFGSLHNARRKIDSFEELLKLFGETEKTATRNEKYVRNEAQKIRKLLTIKRKFVTSQFWNEVLEEIKTLRSVLYSTDEIKQTPTANKYPPHEEIDVVDLDTSEHFAKNKSLSPREFAITSSDESEMCLASDEIVVASDEIAD